MAPIHVYVGFELGGTTCRAGVQNAETKEQTADFTVETEGPDTTLAALEQWATEHTQNCVIKGVGVASFGPIGLDPSDPDFGKIVGSPKKNWNGADVRSAFLKLSPNISIDTDVNAACLVQPAASIPSANCCYITIGTGVGIGVVVNGKPVHGSMHPEAGHILPRRVPGDAPKGTCPYHKDCIEGLVAAGGLAERFEVTPDKLSTVPDNHEGWIVVADYIAQLCVNLCLMVSPKAIYLGGGIMKQKVLLPLITFAFMGTIMSYPNINSVEKKALLNQEFLVLAETDSGLTGAYKLAEAAEEN
eukprot:TRINITY_DN35200_c0_g1_i1.p1 TRINITY_DN35200_c0_g1~~TRINITY_DN35200_c0_g1_i1.p1  ORF type:complete len:302 (-),score=30.54 TRINITY_DN35200_c0_g1_i1:31-936(-)